MFISGNVSEQSQYCKWIFPGWTIYDLDAGEYPGMEADLMSESQIRLRTIIK